MEYRVEVGDCLESLRAMPDQSVHCCVTSPPYFGLRDYGMDGQIGLEDTPQAFVARLVDVFREVRRVLRDDGTLWLNLGDSYSSGTKGAGGAGKSTLGPKRDLQNIDFQKMEARRFSCGIPDKNLLGIPWAVAKALQEPYYTGRIKAERDRVWLAAMLDGEGCFYVHRRLAGGHAGDGYHRKTDNYSCAFEVANTSEAIIHKCIQIAGVGSIIRQDKDRRQPLFRWTVRSQEARALIREVYPHLVAKQQQARIAYGITSGGVDAEPAWEAMKLLHAGQETVIDYPEPPSCFEPGWYLRQEIIWAKPNPMPESVRDRCTKAHEQIFLLSKSPRYYFDSEAMQEPATNRPPGNKQATKGGRNYEAGAEEHRTAANLHQIGARETRNRRSVWTVTTKPFKGAHFATFPPDLIEPCILAGCPVGGTVLDPFGGSGTTAGVALKHGRNAILCELNPEYAALIPERVAAIEGQRRLFP